MRRRSIRSKGIQGYKSGWKSEVPFPPHPASHVYVYALLSSRVSRYIRIAHTSYLSAIKYSGARKTARQRTTNSESGRTIYMHKLPSLRFFLSCLSNLPSVSSTPFLYPVRCNFFQIRSLNNARFSGIVTRRGILPILGRYLLNHREYMLFFLFNVYELIVR